MSFLPDFLLNPDGSLDGWLLIGTLVMAAVVLAIMIAIIMAIVEWLGYCNVPVLAEQGVVKNKYYKSESFSTGVGMAPNGNGGVSPVVTTSYSPEDFIIEYQSDHDHARHRIETDNEIYDSLDIGDKVNAFYKVNKYLSQYKYTGGFEKL